jgi:hypothetical protein
LTYVGAVPARKKKTALRVVDLAPILRGWSAPMAWGVGADRAVYIVARRSAGERLRVDRGIGSFPKATLNQPIDYLVVRVDAAGGGEVRTVIVRRQTLVVSHVQPCDDGLLLVGARCHWRPKPHGPQKNALLVDWRGREKRRFTFGDGIADVRVARDGKIWVSYFDEGIFGNYGWGHPGPPPLGRAGLLAFDARGRRRFEYDPNAAGTDDICDAYATNVTSDGAAWLYFYTEFSIVRIEAGHYRAWKLGVEGARALAVRGDRALLYGDYDGRSIARVVDLAAKRKTAKVIEDLSVVDERGKPIDDAISYGADDALFLFRRRDVLALRDW